MTFAKRRWLNIAILTFFVLLSLTIYTIVSLSLRNVSFITGWALLLLMFALALYNLRKKLPFLPLIKAPVWLQIHIYAGFFSVFLFLLHLNFRIPNGVLEVTLALLYLIVFGSGIFGLILTRVIPHFLTTRGEEVIFERIPLFLRRIREEASRLVSRALSEVDSSTIADFYARRLIHFFAKPGNVGKHLLQSNRPCYALLNELEALNRFLNPEEQGIIKEMIKLVRSKNDLDYHYAHQAILKYWLFVHIPLTYSLLLVTIVHAVLVYTYSGGF